MAQMSYEEFSRMNQNSNSTNTQTNNYRNVILQIHKQTIIEIV